MDAFAAFLIEILSILPFVFLCFLIQLVNYKTEERQNQFVIPFVAFLYCLASVVIIKNDGRLVLLFTSFLPIFDGFVSHQGVYAVNTVMLVIFLIIKICILHIGGNIHKLIKRVKAAGANKISGADEENTEKKNKKNIIVELSEKFIDIFYYSSKKYDNVVLLRNKWTQCKLFYKYIYRGFTGFSVVMILICYQLYAGKILAYPVSPVGFIIILGEIVAFLGGLTEVEFAEKNGIESVNEEPKYADLVPIYKDKFKSRVMDTDIISPVETKDAVNQGVDRIINRLLESSDDDNRLLAKHIKNCINNGFEPEINYIKAAARLNKGKSVIFTTPFYNDLNIYIFFACNRNLLRYKKTLVIVGRSSIEKDVEAWIEEGLSQITGIPSLWDCFMINDDAENKDIGILPYYNINNVEIINKNKEFLDEVGFVIIVEPSKILATAQIGLSNIVDMLNSPVYCAIDKLNEGLLDALAHILRVSIEEVSASAINRGEVTRACIQADGDSLHYNMFTDNTISRYLGVGTELATEAVKFGVGKTQWNSYSNFPVIDMSIIDKEYYSVLCQYMDIPVNQGALEEVISFNINLWNVKKEKNAFIIAEDEECNMYEVVRQYGTRGDIQSFVAVISPDYILREYMESNSYLFENDSRAIPTIVPDYTRSVHNLVIKLIMALRYAPVKEETLRLQLKIMGEEIPEDRSLVSFINEHIEKYFDGIYVYPEQIEENKDDIVNRRKVDAIAIKETDYEFSVLKNTYYVAEDETEDNHYLGGNLLGHIYQKYLPGQFIVLAGKNYEVLSITGRRGMIVRRAEAHIDARHYYRQMRSYNISNLNVSNNIASVKKINGIEISNMTADINVKTDGYIELNEYSDIKHSRFVELNRIPERNYKHKSILAVKFPDINYDNKDNRIDQELCYTLSVIISEILRTMFPDNYQYVAVVTPFEYEGDNQECIDLLRSVNYSVNGMVERNCIYIIEDSEPDLGLIAAFNRNFRRILGIVTDFLMWMSMTEDVRINCDDYNTEGMKKAISFGFNVLATYGLDSFGLFKVADGLLQGALDEIVGSFVDATGEKLAEFITDEIIAPNAEVIKAPVKDKADLDKLECRYLKFGYNHIPEIFNLEKLYAYMLYFGFADSSLVRLRISKVFKKEVEEFNKNGGRAKSNDSAEAVQDTESAEVFEQNTDKAEAAEKNTETKSEISKDVLQEAAVTSETDDI